MKSGVLTVKHICSISTLLAFLVIMGCGSSQQSSTMIYPRKPADTENRKAGTAMLLYEQAEKDLDVNDNVTVVPPEKKTAE